MKVLKYLLTISVVFNIGVTSSPPCFSGIYCFGPLLDTVQLSRVFNDSKTFVDMKMKNNYSITLQNFQDFMSQTKNKPTKSQVRKFVENNFEKGKELERWFPEDYTENPKFLAKISDTVLKDFARHLVQFWPQLARKVKPEVENNSDLYSFIPVPHGFIVPGGRFREFYYWDSYWIINGLLISEMHQTSRGIIDNFIYLIKKYGFVPNGGRIYYLNRSQPPLLTRMVTIYYKHTRDKPWLRENLVYLSQELQYWLNNKIVTITQNGNTYNLAHYKSNCTGPRPESYFEDFKTSAMYPIEKEKERLYKDLKSGAESGWDFSSRWIFDHKGGNVANLSHIEARRVIPVDLNSYLCEAFNLISFLYSEIGDERNTLRWHKLGMSWQKSIEDVLWHNEDGIWYDYDLKLKKPRRFFYPSNLAPLWAGCFDNHRGPILGRRALKYLKTVGALDTPGGIGASTSLTGEQWDFPNAWPPLQGLIVQALHRSGDPKAVAAAKEIASKWISANIRGFRDTGEMYEKYNALRPGIHGGGGEYIVQAGFGWTNGIALHFIHDYFGDSVIKDKKHNCTINCPVVKLNSV